MGNGYRWDHTSPHLTLGEVKNLTGGSQPPFFFAGWAGTS